MTELEMKENLKAKCKESFELLKAYERVLGENNTSTQKQLTKWATYYDLYNEFFSEE